MSAKAKKEKEDTQNRKWLLTFNNPEEHNATHEELKAILSKIKGKLYWCMCDEIGGLTNGYHTHLFIFRPSPFKFSQIKKMFPSAHIDSCFGTNQQNRDYVRKEGEYKDSEKALTSLIDTFEENGECPEEYQGKRNDLVQLYDMIKVGYSNFDILETDPNYMLDLEKIDRCREILRYEEFKNVRRDVYVEYWYGDEGAGKTSGVFERYGGYDKVYRVIDVRNPWDGYKGQDIVMFDDFRDYMFDITLLLRWLDVYPLELPCRYNNKQACFTKVYFTSNVPFEELYLDVQRFDKTTWKAFCRRIHCIKEFRNGSIVDYVTVDDYLKRNQNKDGFMKVSAAQ